MNLFALFRDVNTKEEAIDYLQGKNIFHQQLVCRKGHNMTLRLVKRDEFRCCKKSCIGVRVGTWLEGSKMPLGKVPWFIYAWCRQYTSSKFCDKELLSMSTRTSNDWRTSMRDVCAKSLLLNPMVIGGEGLTVEMHELCFSRKAYRESRVLEQQWVFGGVCRETSECFLFAVAEPKAETLLAEAVSASVRPGSTIVSFLFTTYGSSQLLPEHYTLVSIDQFQTVFVNPATGSQEEVLWCASKRAKRKEYSQRRGQDSYLCEFLWRKKHENVDLVDQIYKDIASVYPLQDVVQ